ncbi:ATPase [Bacilli bacterium]|nr:ATPase [Bacilli bacterium]
MNYKNLKAKILSNAVKDKVNYLFLDEIQDVKNFERTLIQLFESKTIQFDIYITGSNSVMFSSSLATLFTGRNIEIKVYPLAFKEYYTYYKEFDSSKERQEIFEKYVLYGGLPIYLKFLENENKIKDSLSSVFLDSAAKDVKKRHKLKNVDEFNIIAKYIYQNIGQPASALKIANKLRSETKNKSKITYRTVLKYIQYMEEACLIYKCPAKRVYDKNFINGSIKYYSVDTGLRNSESDFQNINRGSQLENIVYLELLRRGYKVTTGKLKDDREIDFIAQKDGKYEYYQVAQYVQTDEQINREYGNLNSIKDSFPKYVLSMMMDSGVDNKGVCAMNIIEWLMKD